jgi:acrylyl-CoA reductase (NADPH)
VVASTGRAEEAGYLRDLGASEIIDRSELSEPGPPLGAERWAGGIDAVGSHTLANVLAQIKYGGAVSACGLAQGVDLPATVMPLILRGVTLMGIDSVMAPKGRREEAWRRLGEQLDLEKLDAMTSHIPLDGVPEAAGKILAGQIRGRLVVDL